MSKFIIDTYNTIGNCSKEDLEADYFAYCLLMPEKILRDILSMTRDISAIAKYFGVSEKKLEARINLLRENE